MLMFNPSTAHLWMKCAASVRAFQLLGPQKDTEKKREGRLADKLILKKVCGVDIDEPYDDEMSEAVDLYVSELEENARIEAEIDLSVLRPGMTGRVDACYQSADRKLLRLWDFKYGHRAVAAHENPQLLVSLAAFDLTGVEEIVLTIVQPRAFKQEGPVDSWSLSPAEYQRVYLPAVKQAVENALSLKPRYQTGPHCALCPAKGICPALQQAAATAADLSADFQPAHDMDVNEIGVELAILLSAQRALNERISGLEEQAIAKIESGKPVPGFTLQAGFGRPRWTKSPDALFALGDLAGVNLRKEPQPITPSQAIAAGLEERVVKSISERPATSPKLKPVDFNKLGKVFKNG